MYFNKTGVDKLDQVEKNIESLIKIKKENKVNKPMIFVRLIVADDTEKEIKVFRNKWRNKPVVLEIRDMHNYGGNVANSHVIKKQKRYPCYHLWLAPAIHWNGDVSICCDDYKRQALLGNVNQKTVHEMWTSEKINHYRRLHLSQRYDKMPLCGDCDVWNIYSDLFFNWQKK
jgi:radical SAM protein with 4Fe4S-binding SPASM domain